jgi:alpha-L-fucosidase 2
VERSAARLCQQRRHNYLEELRQLLWEGKQDEAHELGNKHFMSQPFGQLSYLPFGNIELNFPAIKMLLNYQRRPRFGKCRFIGFLSVDGCSSNARFLLRLPAQALIIRLEASENGALNFAAGLNSPHSEYEVSVDGDQIILRGKANNYHQELGRDGKPYPESKLTFEARLRIEHEGGGLVQYEDSIAVVNARKATLFLVAATSFVNYDDISGNPEEQCMEPG